MTEFETQVLDLLRRITRAVEALDQNGVTYGDTVRAASAPRKSGPRNRRRWGEDQGRIVTAVITGMIEIGLTELRLLGHRS